MGRVERVLLLGALGEERLGDLAVEVRVQVRLIEEGHRISAKKLDNLRHQKSYDIALKICININ